MDDISKLRETLLKESREKKIRCCDDKPIPGYLESFF